MSTFLPDTEKSHNDVVDFLTDACQMKVQLPDENGKLVTTLVLNEKKVWYKTLQINHPQFGRFVKMIEDLDYMAVDCFNFMSASRARVLAQQIQKIVENYMYSMDAKSSESIRDKHNSQPTLVHLLLRQKSERAITLKGEAERSFKDALLGREKKDAIEY